MVWVLESFVLILREFEQMRKEREEKGEAAAFGGGQEGRVWSRRFIQLEGRVLELYCVPR